MGTCISLLSPLEGGGSPELGEEWAQPLSCLTSLLPLTSCLGFIWPTLPLGGLLPAALGHQPISKCEDVQTLVGLPPCSSFLSTLRPHAFEVCQTPALLSPGEPHQSGCSPKVPRCVGDQAAYLHQLLAQPHFSLAKMFVTLLDSKSSVVLQMFPRRFFP